MSQMLELPDKDFKAAIVIMLLKYIRRLKNWRSMKYDKGPYGNMGIEKFINSLMGLIAEVNAHRTFEE